MTDTGSHSGYEEWVAGQGDEPDERFKWGWNPERGETVWVVGGPGDGFPSHREYLETAWGRAPDMAHGDVLGVAYRYAGGVRNEDGQREVIEIDAFYGQHVPVSVVDWFGRVFPEALVRPGRQ